MKPSRVLALTFLGGGLAAAPQAPPPATPEPLAIRVDAGSRTGPMKPVWAFFGYDEPNYTYMKDGRKLLSEIAALSPVPVYVRTHNLLTTGDGTAALKWGSTNAYTEDEAGRPRYDWTIVDRIFDTYLERGMKPLVEIGFMPEALSVKPRPYRHDWKPGDNYARIFTGWAYPPKDYDRWRELVFQWVRHAVEKYGRAEVESWWWEVWNEPDIGYWQGTPEEYAKLYDYAADGLKRALPTARIGGPHVTGPLGARAQKFFRDFLEHCLRGQNHATGRTGAPLDFVGFHAKGAPRVTDAGHVRMGLGTHLQAIENGFAIVASYPELRDVPIVIGESDPEGCAACPVRTSPQNAYRNGTMYSSYTAAQIARTYELAARHRVNLLGSVTWAFEFEGQPYFDGFRDLATNGIDKPVLNVFRMLGRMGGDFVSVHSTGALALDAVRVSGVRGRADVNAIAARRDRTLAVLVWNYHDDDLPATPASVNLSIEGMPARRATLEHFRVDADHGNAYEAWKRMGSPQPPTDEQYAALEKTGQLAMLEPARRVDAADGNVNVTFTLPRQGVSLVLLRWSSAPAPPRDKVSLPAMTKRPTTLGVIVGNRGFFPSHLCSTGRTEVLDVLRREGFGAVALEAGATPHGAVESLADARACADLFRTRRDEIDGVIVTLPNFGDERAIANTLRWADLGVPVLVHAFSDDGARMTIEHRRDSFCGKMSACNNLRQYGIPYSLTSLHTVAPAHPSFIADLRRFGATCRVVRHLKGARIGAIGARPAAFNTVRFSEKLFERAGISVETLDLSEVLGWVQRMADGEPAVKAKLDAIGAYTGVQGIPTLSLMRMAKLGVAIDRWMHDKQLSATAIQCWTALEEFYGVVPCTLMSMMSESLLPSACETDIAGLLGMYVLQAAAEQPAALLDWNNNYGDDPDKGVVFHCSNLPKSFFGEHRMDYQEIIAGTVGKENTFGTIVGRVSPGPFTYCRVSTDDLTGRIASYVGEGRFTDDRLETFGGYGVIEVPNFQELLRMICRRGFEHHVAATRATVAEAIEDGLRTYLGWDTYRHV